MAQSDMAMGHAHYHFGALDPGDIGVMVQWHRELSANATHVDYVLSEDFPTPVVTNLDTVIGVFKSGVEGDVFHQHDSVMESRHHTRKKPGAGLGKSYKTASLGPCEHTKTNDYRSTAKESLVAKQGNPWRMTRASTTIYYVTARTYLPLVVISGGVKRQTKKASEARLCVKIV
jgi:hypothetical protein